MLIRRLADDAEAWTCADLMAGTDPWLTYGRGRDATHRAVVNPDAETYVAILDDQQIAGLVVIELRGAFVGYIRVLAVAADRRGQGVGTALLSFAEERIFAVSPNVFLCVSAFNPRARQLYERRGFRHVGTLSDYIVAGIDEHLMRRTVGPIDGYLASMPNAE